MNECLPFLQIIHLNNSNTSTSTCSCYCYCFETRTQKVKVILFLARFMQSLFSGSDTDQETLLEQM